MTNDLTCPKCVAPLRSIERNGATVERCTECGGIFLDRGELERLIQAEGEFNARTFRDYPASSSEPHGRYRDGYQEEHREEYPSDRHPSDYPPKRRERGGFLGDLLDFG